MIDDSPDERQPILGSVQEEIIERTLRRRGRNEIQIEMFECFGKRTSVLVFLVIFLRNKIVGGKLGKLIGRRLCQHAAEFHQRLQSTIAVWMPGQILQVLSRKIWRMIA